MTFHPVRLDSTNLIFIQTKNEGFPIKVSLRFYVLKYYSSAILARHSARTYIEQKIKTSPAIMVNARSNTAKIENVPP